MNKEFLKQRIAIFSGKDIDPNVDAEVIDILKRKFAILLPQRPTLNESLDAVIKSHEVIGLILNYRNMSK